MKKELQIIFKNEPAGYNCHFSPPAVTPPSVVHNLHMFTVQEELHIKSVFQQVSLFKLIVRVGL